MTTIGPSRPTFVIALSRLVVDATPSKVTLTT
jgi:hypothetical protein